MRRQIKRWMTGILQPWRKVFFQSFDRYLADQKERERLNFTGIGPGSVVFDFGGFEGNWAADMHARYGCKVQVFEPHPAFAARLVERFSDNADISVHDFALGSTDGTLDLSDDGDASSALHSDPGQSVTGKICSVRDFFAAHDFPEIALMKINIEGGEYDLLPALAECNVLDRTETLQIQFHLFEESHILLRDEIVDAIEKTHSAQWSYPFVWEQWRRR